MNTDEPRPCERQCRTCNEWKHHSRFQTKRRDNRGNSTIPTKIWFSPDCRDCEQKARNEKKNDDRPLAIIRARARAAATRAGKSLEFFWIQMNFQALVPLLRAMMTDEALCLNCGHPFVNERDIQIEHREPPRHRQDWARLHARNLGFSCASCNRTKSNKPNDVWLDEQEGARLSNLEEKRQEPKSFANDLFENLPEEARGRSHEPTNLIKLATYILKRRH